MNNIVLIVLVVILMLVAMFLIPQWRLRRAISQVIRIFREQGAVDARSARTVIELGLKPRNMMEGMFKGRDYRPYALRALRKAEIIQMTDEGRLYLSEDKLVASGLDRSSPYSR